MQDETIANLLYLARSEGRAPDPAVLKGRPEREEALAVQIEVLRKFEAAGGMVGGWKVGLTSGAMRDSMGEGFRPFGFILADRIVTSPACLALDRIFRCQVEPELCLVLGNNLSGPHVDAEMARKAVSSVAPAFEINEKRVLVEDGRELLVADGLANWGIVVGDKVPVPQDLSVLSVEFRCDGVVLSAGQPVGGMDDHFLSLARLCNFLDSHGRSLKAGDHIITGAFDKRMVPAAASFEALFEGLGKVQVTFS